MRKANRWPTAAVAVIGSNQQSYVGWDGMTYIDPVQQHNRLSVIPADGGAPCRSASARQSAGATARRSPRLPITHGEEERCIGK